MDPLHFQAILQIISNINCAAYFFKEAKA